MAARLRALTTASAKGRTLRRALSVRACTAALSLAVTGCIVEPTGVDIALYPDPNLNTLPQVLAQTRSMLVVLDADDGLYFPGDEMDDGTISIRDFDGDPTSLELVARVVAPASRLPRIRIERGGLPDTAVDVAVYGYEGADGTGELVAEGSLPLMLNGTHVAIAVPFNLRAERRPPSVASVVAANSVGCSPPELAIVFSRPIDAASVLGPGIFTFQPGGAPLSVRIDSVAGAGTVATVQPPAGVASGGRIAFTLTVSTGVVDLNGIHLDQRLPLDGNQPYVGRYDAPCPP